MLEIMERYGWTYEEYMQQPFNLIELAKSKMSIEAQVSKNNNGVKISKKK